MAHLVKDNGILKKERKIFPYIFIRSYKTEACAGKCKSIIIMSRVPFTVIPALAYTFRNNHISFFLLPLLAPDRAKLAVAKAG